MVTPLGDEARREEIARMLGGVDITEQTLAHAGEMLQRGQAASRGKSSNKVDDNQRTEATRAT